MIAKPHENIVKTTYEDEDFLIIQFFVNCLSEFSYYVESHGEAVIIDPLRETQPYIHVLKIRQSKLRYVLETHLHADFVSGHQELAQLTGATIVYGPTANPSFKIKQAKDGELLSLGKIHIRVDHTPGHTPESSCFVLLKGGIQYCVFSGDTLFLNEVGRPDLAVKSNLTKDDLASMLYDSIQKKIMPLPDECIIYPGHGAGSACGKSIGSGAYCTIGKQKKNNYALQYMPREEFILKVAGSLPNPPQYFFHDAALNKSDIEPYDVVLSRCLKALTYEQFMTYVRDGAQILDSRVSIKEGFINGALNIVQVVTFATFVGTLIKPTTQIILITDPSREIEAVNRLLRIGYQNILGYLEGGYKTYVQHDGPRGQVNIVEPKYFLDTNNNPEEHIFLDVRSQNEVSESGSLPHALNIPLQGLAERTNEIPKDKTIHVFCKTGGRAKMGMSILRKNGFDKFVITEAGGVDQIAAECGIQLTHQV